MLLTRAGSGVGKALAAMLAGDEGAVVEYVKRMTPQRFGADAEAAAARAASKSVV